MKTKIIFGRFDFLLLNKEKHDETNCYNIPPVFIDKNPDFKFGKMNEEDNKLQEEQKRERINQINEKNNELINEKNKKKRKHY